MKRLVLLSAFLAGCIFSTRSPQPPDSSTTFIWIPATTPDLLMQDMIGALKTLDAPDYIRVFITSNESTSNAQKSFSFAPASDINQSERALFTDWGISNEQSWVTNLAAQLPQSSQMTLLLTDTVTDESSTTASLSYKYTISLPSATPSIIPQAVQGSLQFQIAFITTDEGTREWRIVSWSDFLPQSGNGPTWSDLKVDLSS